MTLDATEAAPTSLTPGMEPEARRAAAAAMLEEFCSSDAIAAWVALRRSLYTFSLRNQMMLAAQAHGRGVTISNVQAKWKWRKAGYWPAYANLDDGLKGAFYVWAFRSRRRKDRSWTCRCKRRRTDDGCTTCGMKDHYFVVAPEYAAEQVINDKGERPPGPPVPEPLTGDSHERLIQPLMDWALAELDDVETIEMGADCGEAGGFFRKSEKLIRVADGPPNERLAVLVHECCHAMGVDYESYSRPEAELIVESAAMLACASLGLDTGGQSMAYVAGWGGRDGESPADTLQRHLRVIDDLARRIEKALADEMGDDS